MLNGNQPQSSIIHVRYSKTKYVSSADFVIMCKIIMCEYKKKLQVKSIICKASGILFKKNNY